MTHMVFNNCKVFKIVDGDTIDVLIDLGFNIVIKERLRLLDVDASELRSTNPEEREKAQIAKKYLEDILTGKVCTIITKKSDKYGRYLAEVYIPYEDDNETYFSVNTSLLDLGYAVRYKE